MGDAAGWSGRCRGVVVRRQEGNLPGAPALLRILAFALSGAAAELLMLVVAAAVAGPRSPFADALPNLALSAAAVRRARRLCHHRCGRVPGRRLRLRAGRQERIRRRIRCGRCGRHRDAGARPRGRRGGVCDGRGCGAARADPRRGRTRTFRLAWAAKRAIGARICRPPAYNGATQDVTNAPRCGPPRREEVMAGIRLALCLLACATGGMAA